MNHLNSTSTTKKYTSNTRIAFLFQTPKTSVKLKINQFSIIKLINISLNTGMFEWVACAKYHKQNRLCSP